MTCRPVASMTRYAASGCISASTAATRPPARATSNRPLRPAAGSSRWPPLINVSNLTSQPSGVAAGYRPSSHCEVGAAGRHLLQTPQLARVPYGQIATYQPAAQLEEHHIPGVEPPPGRGHAQVFALVCDAPTPGHREMRQLLDHLVDLDRV